MRAAAAIGRREGGSVGTRPEPLSPSARGGPGRGAGERGRGPRPPFFLVFVPAPTRTAAAAAAAGREGVEDDRHAVKGENVYGPEGEGKSGSWWEAVCADPPRGRCAPSRPRLRCTGGTARSS